MTDVFQTSQLEDSAERIGMQPIDPSPTQAWTNVYRSALTGCFDITLAKANTTAKVTGLPIGTKRIVTRLELLTGEPADLPHPFARSAAKSLFVVSETNKLRPTHWKFHAPNAAPHPASFARVPSNERIVRRAKRIFKQLKNDPVWEEIVAVLCVVESACTEAELAF